MDDIIFYKSGYPFNSCFSNFFHAPILIDGKVWPTSEHYFQAMKFSGIDEEYAERIRLSPKPGKAFFMGRRKQAREDWGEVKNEVMKNALRAKFTQHQELRQELLKTDNGNIIQRCGHDKYWGDGYPDKGENMLGKLLMEIREEIKIRIHLKNIMDGLV
jgi:ribA/ribD-fused uncharacterized protein